MKKIPAILLSLLLLFSLAACTDGGEAEPTELGARNAYRAAALAQTVFEDYYDEDTGIAPEKLPEKDGVDIASVWDYVTMMSLADRMIDVDGENARWTELRDSLYAFLPYYGQFRTDEWMDVPYASRRGDREFWSTATMTYDDQIWIIREFLGTGCVFGVPLTADLFDPILIFILPPGGFFVFGMLIALANRLSGNRKKPEETACGACPLAGSCSKIKKEEERPQ